MSAQPVGVLAVLDEAMRHAEERGNMQRSDRLREARAAVAELVERAERVAATLETPTLAKQSGKNTNAGFIDWRDWCALLAEVRDLRAALARVQGGAA